MEGQADEQNYFAEAKANFVKISSIHQKELDWLASPIFQHLSEDDIRILFNPSIELFQQFDNQYLTEVKEYARSLYSQQHKAGVQNIINKAKQFLQQVYLTYLKELLTQILNKLIQSLYISHTHFSTITEIDVDMQKYKMQNDENMEAVLKVFCSYFFQNICKKYQIQQNDKKDIIKALDQHKQQQMFERLKQKNIHKYRGMIIQIKQSLKQIQRAFFFQSKQPPILKIFFKQKLTNLRTLNIRNNIQQSHNEANLDFSIDAFSFVKALHQQPNLQEVTIIEAHFKDMEDFVNRLNKVRLKKVKNQQIDEGQQGWLQQFSSSKVALKISADFELKDKETALTVKLFFEQFKSVSQVAITINIEQSKIEYQNAIMEYQNAIMQCLSSRSLSNFKLIIQKYLSLSLLKRLSSLTSIRKFTIKSVEFKKFTNQQVKTVKSSIETMFQNNKQITTLELYYCQDIPYLPQIQNLSYLKFRQISNFIRFPELIQIDPSLKTICATLIQPKRILNKLLPSLHSITQLVMIDIDFSNQLSRIPSKHLKRLIIQNNSKITNKDIQKIMKNWPYLTHLTIRCSNIKQIKKQDFQNLVHFSEESEQQKSKIMIDSK